MIFEIELERMFRMWIKELEEDDQLLQAAAAELVLKSFLSWYNN